MRTSRSVALCCSALTSLSFPQQVIYRFLTSGTMDEKIFQRQTTKLGLSGSLMVSRQIAGRGETDADPRYTRTTTTSALRAKETLSPSVM